MRVYVAMAIVSGALACTPGGGGGGGQAGPACEIPTCEGEYQLAVVLSGGAFEDSANVYRPGSESVDDPAHRIVGYICTFYTAGVPDAESAGWSAAVWMLPADESGVDGEIVAAFDRTPCTGEVVEATCGEGEADFLSFGRPSQWADPDRVAETECGETPAE